MKEAWKEHPLSEPFEQEDKLEPIVTVDIFRDIVSPFRKLTDEILANLALGLNSTLRQYEINTPLRIVHFLGQTMHESMCFKYSKEIWGPTPAQSRYEGRVDLGNIQEGDGKRYMGRGYIQITGRTNYTQITKEIGGLFHVDFVNYPDLLQLSYWAMLSAGWYWNSRKLNKFADLDNIRGVTLRINGGYNGLEDRIKYTDHCKSILILT